MAEQIEQYMRTLKLGGLAKNWRSVQYVSTEQYLTELLRIELHEREINRINRMVKTAGYLNKIYPYLKAIIVLISILYYYCC